MMVRSNYILDHSFYVDNGCIVVQLMLDGASYKAYLEGVDGSFSLSYVLDTWGDVCMSNVLIRVSALLAKENIL